TLLAKMEKKKLLFLLSDNLKYQFEIKRLKCAYDVARQWYGHARRNFHQLFHHRTQETDCGRHFSTLVDLELHKISLIEAASKSIEECNLSGSLLLEELTTGQKHRLKVVSRAVISKENSLTKAHERLDKLREDLKNHRRDVDPLREVPLPELFDEITGDVEKLGGKTGGHQNVALSSKENKDATQFSHKVADMSLEPIAKDSGVRLANVDVKHGDFRCGGDAIITKKEVDLPPQQIVQDSKALLAIADTNKTGDCDKPKPIRTLQEIAAETINVFQRSYSVRPSLKFPENESKLNSGSRIQHGPRFQEVSFLN
ncbi:unnamed protein product, partial [Caenorhabditis auriculariae]